MRSPQLIAKGPVTFNMTPMIDVVFLLIIFFLVSSHLAKQENAVKLDLPEANSGLDEQAEVDTVVVNVLADGSWKVGGATVDESKLTANLRQRMQDSNGTLQLKIRTDENVGYQRLEPVLRSASKNGIGDIVFSVYEDKGK